jgi:NAD+ diphosphatase
VWPPGRFSILAGFVEPGESAEGAVAREVGEEVGLRVTDIRYVASQPWPFPQSLMLGFTARVDGDPTLRVDEDEIEEARWFTRDELRSGAGPRALPPPVSIARHIIDRWVAGEVYPRRLARTSAGRSGWSASTTASARAAGSTSAS